MQNDKEPTMQSFDIKTYLQQWKNVNEKVAEENANLTDDERKRIIFQLYNNFDYEWLAKKAGYTTEKLSGLIEQQKHFAKYRVKNG